MNIYKYLKFIIIKIYNEYITFTYKLYFKFMIKGL